MKLWFSKKDRPDTSSMPLYQRRRSFMEEHETALYKALLRAVGNDLNVLPKVKLFSLVEPQIPGSNRQSQLHWIKGHQQLVDFVLCLQRDMEPVIAVRQMTTIEDLQRPIKGPDMIGTVLRDIALPTLYVRAPSNYEAADLRKRLRMTLGKIDRPATQDSAA